MHIIFEPFDIITRLADVTKAPGQPDVFPRRVYTRLTAWVQSPGDTP
jgi:hypothetical protein